MCQKKRRTKVGVRVSVGPQKWVSESPRVSVSESPPEVWIAFQKSYPGRYQVGVRKELALIQSALESECVCGGEDEYRRELQAFLKNYPSSPFKSGVASRLEAVNNHTFKIRFHCQPH
jgi:hypothetical protein